ncbi:MAG: SpoIIE family protein phosphatase [Nitrospira sp.]|nr:SpoIIE family protein phosphatase [Nitrospira sp.]
MPSSSAQSDASSGSTAGATPSTVLVVDDEPVSRASMAARLKRLGYRVLQAGEGKTGLELLRRERPELTILDWMMPEMDGPSFCELVRQDSAIQSSQILMMTGHDRPEEIAEGLARGADDFLSKAASGQEITARVQAGLRTAMLIRRLEHATDEIRRKQDVLEQELQSAAQYVKSLLPPAGMLLPGLELAHAYRPSLALGGDLFNVLRWDNDQIGLYLLDASGHGVAPALRSAGLSTFLRGGGLRHQPGSRDPGGILTEANKQFPLTEEGTYFTIIFARFDLKARTLSFASAGHSGAFLHHSSGGVTWLKNSSLPLGFCVPNIYETIHLPVPLSPGDRLYLFSDGVYEVPAPSGEMWGQERFAQTVLESGELPMADVIARTVERAAQWLGHDQFPDDVALMGIELTA